MSVADNVKEFYVHDLVFKFDERKRIIFGVVIDSYEGSDTDEYPSLQKGQILVLWNNSARKQICKQTKVHLMSRSVIPGDIVRRLEDGKETQRGYCKETKQSVCVQIVGTDKIIEHVSNNRIFFVKPYDVGDAVCLGDKFGRIQGIDKLIRMQSKCGSIVEIRSSINYNIRDAWSSTIYGVFFEASYPGQTVLCIPMDLKDAKWIKKSKAMKRKMDIDQCFTIQSIQNCLIEVWWYNYTSNGHAEYAELKDDEIEKIQILPFSTHLVLSDRQLLKLRPTDILLKKSEWLLKKSLIYQPDRREPSVDIAQTGLNNEEIDEDWCTEEDDESTENNKNSSTTTHSASTKYKSRYNKSRNSYKPNKFVLESILAVDVLCTDSKSTIVWQDGTEEKDVPSTELYYSVSLDDHEFFPGEWIMAANATTTTNNKSAKYGVVQSVNYLERTAQIKWFSYSEEEKIPKPMLINEMSVYELKKHPKFIFRPGSVVKAKPTQFNKMGKVIDSCPEGYVIVQWLDGSKENCWPQSIELIPESEEYEFSDGDESDENEADGEDAISWETESIESFDGDVTDEINLQNMATKVDFIRSRIIYLMEAFKQHNVDNNFFFLKDLLCVYDNSRYLDKYLGTSLFSLRSTHFQALLHETKKKAKSQGIELRGRLFLKDNVSSSMSLIKDAEKENIQKIKKLENIVNIQIEVNKDAAATATTNDVLNTAFATNSSDSFEKCEENLCKELLLMLKIRMDLAYAEIISRIDSEQALTVLSNASDSVMKPSASMITVSQQSNPATPDESLSSLNPPKFVKSNDIIISNDNNDTFCIIEEAPNTHHYYSSKFEAIDLQKFLKALRKEYKLLKESLPSGVWVRSYGNRIDLLSVMIKGPAKTPYEDGLFLFDIQLSPDYPRSPPIVHYISYSTEGLNPNLYVEGKVCVSLLGTWLGRGSEVWGPNSTLLQLIVSIQGLILVAEPYYNEAGYEKQTATQQGYENSRTYNELVLLKLVQSMTELLNATPKVFRNEILMHFKINGQKLCERLRMYCDNNNLLLKPDFPLLPVSKGLKLSLSTALNTFQDTLKIALIDSVNNANGSSDL